SGAPLRLTATRIATGFSQPVLVRAANDGTSRMFVVQKQGLVRVLRRGRVLGTFLDIRSLVNSDGERGLLGLAFAPDFAKSHLLW
ncbi:glucose/sorbosone dehydrogenase-like protein, partial [Streptomyces brasiliscabiei]